MSKSTFLLFILIKRRIEISIQIKTIFTLDITKAEIIPINKRIENPLKIYDNKYVQTHTNEKPTSITSSYIV